MKKLLLLIVLSAFGGRAFAQRCDRFSLPHDSTGVFMPEAFVFSKSLDFDCFKMAISDAKFVPRRIKPPLEGRLLDAQSQNPHALSLRVVIHQKIVRYGGKPVFLWPPKLIIYSEQVYK